MIRIIFCSLLIILTACGDGGPGAPSSPAGQLSKGVIGGGTLRGRVADVVTGEPLAGASLHALGVTVETAADGAFTLDAPFAGPLSLRIEADGYWSRETQSQPGSQARITLLPDDERFDLQFFDHLFRELGASGTHPWSTEPRFEIWLAVYRCRRLAEEGACDELEATSERASPEFERMARQVIQTDGPLYSGDAIRGTTIYHLEHEAGRRLVRDQFLEPGKVTLVLVEREDDFSWAFTQSHAQGHTVSASLQINRKHVSFRGIYSHELAHALGFRHPLGLEAVPRDSIMRAGHGPWPTANDRLYGRILYSRPANSLSPDRDPEEFVLDRSLPPDGLAAFTRVER